MLHKWETRTLSDPVDRFIELCGQVYDQTNRFLQELTKGGLSKPSRDSSIRIKRILGTDQPLDCFLILRERMEKLKPSEFTKIKLALHYENIALVALMNIKPLRVGTLVKISKDEIYRDTDGCWYANLPKSHFKNERFGARDGWVGEVHKSVWSALDNYWDLARPILTSRSDYGSFWVTDRGRPMSESSFHMRFLQITKQFIPDFAPEGVNPHAWRQVVAHDNFKTDRVTAVLKSAQQLNDLPKTILKAYAKDNDRIRNQWINDQTDARLSRRKASPSDQ